MPSRPAAVALIVVACAVVAALLAPPSTAQTGGHADEVSRRLADWESSSHLKPFAGLTLAPAAPAVTGPPPGARWMSLHVGLDRLNPTKYPNVPHLAAAAADASRLYESAGKSGIPDRRLLLNEEATVERVLAEMKRATQTLQGEGDLYLMTFSGHGGLVPDYNKDQYPRMTDQAFCLFDRMLVDDEVIVLWPDFKPKVRVLILLDSCHSGTSVQSSAMFDTKKNQVAVSGQSRGLGSDYRIRSPGKTPHEDAIRVQEPELRNAITNLQVGDAIKRTEATILRLAACRGDQVAIETGGQGLFTKTLLEIWQERPFQLTYRQVRDEAGKRIGLYQEPTIDHYGPEVERFVGSTSFAR